MPRHAVPSRPRPASRAFLRAVLPLATLLGPLVGPGRALQEARVDWGPWHLLMPFEHAANDGVEEPHPVERELARCVADGPGPDLQAVYRGKSDLRLGWRALPGERSGAGELDVGALDLLTLLPPGAPAGSADNSCAYLWRAVAATGSAEVDAYMGSDDSLRVWLNGELVHEYRDPRGLDPYQDRVRLKLEQGVNHLLVKVVNLGGGWGYRIQPYERLGGGDRAQAQAAVNAAIDRGVQYLLDTQQRDGSWSYHHDPYRNGQTALTIYTLLDSGVPPQHQAIRRGLAYLRTTPPKKVYSAACQLLALGALQSEEHLEWIEETADLLLDWQQGTFAYPDGVKDLSNTQYGALGLWMASLRGVRVPASAWRNLCTGTLSYQNSDGGFAYKPGEASTGSMTAAGVAVLSICTDRLDGKPPKANAVAEARELGRAWLAHEFEGRFGPQGGAAGGSERWFYYYLYGLERVAALERLERIGELDWYWVGAERLVHAQEAGGDWGTAYGENEANTCFALLFLQRATAVITGRRSDRAAKTYVTEDPSAEVILRATGDTPLNLWVAGFGKDAFDRGASEGARGRGLYFLRVEYLADGEVVRTLDVDGEEKWASQKYPIQHAFERPGEHTVAVRLHVAGRDDESGRAVVLRSPPLTVLVEQRVEPWMLDYADDELDNLLLRNDAEARASSRRGDNNPAGHAIDGWQGTAWVCAATDAAPTLTIDLERAVRANAVVFSHASGMPKDRGKLDVATVVELTINGAREPLRVELDPDERRKTVFSLDKLQRIQRLDVRVLERTRGSASPGCVGFAEIDLRDGRRRR